MSLRYQFFTRFSINSRCCHLDIDIKPETSLVILANADRCGCFAVFKLDFLCAGSQVQCAVKTSRIACRKKLFGIGKGSAWSPHFFGNRSSKVQYSIRRGDVFSGSRCLCGIQYVHDRVFCLFVETGFFSVTFVPFTHRIERFCRCLATCKEPQTVPAGTIKASCIKNRISATRCEPHCRGIYRKQIGNMHAKKRQYRQFPVHLDLCR